MSDIKKRLEALVVAMSAGVDDPKVIPLIKTVVESLEEIQTLEGDIELLNAKVKQLNNNLKNMGESHSFLHSETKRLKKWQEFVRFNSKDAGYMADDHLLTTNKG